jgi:hypothetical protein
MKVALAPSYRNRMFALLPATLGVGTAVLWARSLRWPRNIDADGLTLGYRRRVPWRSVERIGVWRDYCDGDVSRIDIHHGGSVDKVPVGALRDGQMIASTILALFDERRRGQHLSEVKPLRS